MFLTLYIEKPHKNNYIFTAENNKKKQNENIQYLLNGTYICMILTMKRFAGKRNIKCGEMWFDNMVCYN